VKRDKQVIVVATKWSLGKEVAQIKRGIFILNVRRIKSFIKKSPRYKSGV
jgi:hypothetical protein